MTYIRCPECGQKALSVATQCPKCGFVLAQNPMQSGGERGLVECRECQKMIPRGMAECPYCGYAGRSTLWRVLSASAVIVLVAGAGFGVWWLLSGATDGSAEQSPAPPPPVSVTPDPAAARGPRLPEADTGMTAGDAAGDSASDTAQAAAPVTAPVTERSAPTSLFVRWTDNWVNLREGPGLGYGVVRIFRPGVRVEVGQPRNGWWPVWERGEVVGYVAGSELTRAPPDPGDG